MRKQFLIECKSKRTAMKLTPWACCWLKADGGYWAFESSADAYTYVQQK